MKEYDHTAKSQKAQRIFLFEQATILFWRASLIRRRSRKSPLLAQFLPVSEERHSCAAYELHTPSRGQTSHVQKKRRCHCSSFTGCNNHAVRLGQWAPQIPKYNLAVYWAETASGPSPPMVLSWYSWNCPLTKRSTKLDFPTADSPNSTSLNWQILLLAAVALVRAGPPRPAMVGKTGAGGREWGEERRSREKREEGWWGGRVEIRQMEEPWEEEEETTPGKHNILFSMLSLSFPLKQLSWNNIMGAQH